MLLPSTTIAQSSVILAQPSHTLSHLLLGSPSSIPPPFYTAANSHTASPHTLTALSCASALLQQSTCVVPTSYMFAMVPASSPDQGFKFTPHNCSHFLRFPPKLRIFFSNGGYCSSYPSFCLFAAVHLPFYRYSIFTILATGRWLRRLWEFALNE